MEPFLARVSLTVRRSPAELMELDEPDTETTRFSDEFAFSPAYRMYETLKSKLQMDNLESVGRRCRQGGPAVSVYAEERGAERPGPSGLESLGGGRASRVACFGAVSVSTGRDRGV